jgi:hypothetical protein
MIKVNKSSEIAIYWKIWRGVNKNTEVFDGKSNLKVFLIGTDDTYSLSPSVSKDADGCSILEMTIPENTLAYGAYDLKAIWKKNDGRTLMMSMRSNIFGIAADEEAPVRYEEIRVVSYVESYGRDGLSAYELAVMRGVISGISEVKWLEAMSLDKWITTDMIGDEAVTLPKLSSDVQKSVKDVSEIKGQVTAIQTGASVSISVVPNVIEAGVETNVKVSATFSPSSIVADNISIMREGTILSSEDNANEATYEKTYKMFSGDVVFSGLATYKGLDFIKHATLSARYPTYVGFGEEYGDIVNNKFKKIVSSVAGIRYTYTPSDASYFILLVPSGVTKPKRITMGNNEAVMNTSTVSINGVSYTVYKSVNKLTYIDMSIS